jgi:hypothetical protein
MLATRASIVAELLIASVATVLVAMSSPYAASSSMSHHELPLRWSCALPMPTQHEAMRVVHVELRSAPAKRDCSLGGTRAAMYRDRDFGAVALALGSCSEAELMRELDRTYALATASDADLGARFDAVREAYRVDLGFGGAHSSELLDAETMIGARYMNELMRRHDADAAFRVERIITALR